MAQGNLEQEFRKIVVNVEKGELDAVDDQGLERAMISRYLLLHARSYKVKDIIQYDDIEDEVLSQLARVLTRSRTESILNKIVLINISAQYYAGVRLQEASKRQEKIHNFENMYAFLSILRLNVRVFSVLLDVLRTELQALSHEASPSTAIVPGMKTALDSKTARLTVIARRILPLCRHYSSWLMSNVKLVVAEMSTPELEKDITGFFKIYANTLTVLASTFNPETLPIIEYLLEEDEDTMAFKPFDHQRTFRRYYDQSSRTLKPNFHIQGITREHPLVEMLGRVRDLVTDGVELSTQHVSQLCSPDCLRTSANIT